jgi:hypothetical protein
MRTTVKVDETSTIGAPAEIVRQVEAADESLRKSFAGLPVEDVVPEVERSLTEIGIEVPTAQVREYAQHIVDRADYDFVLPSR